MKLMKPTELQKARMEALEAKAILDALIDEDLKKAKGDAYKNPDGTFKGGFKGCMRYQQEAKGLAAENARRLCAYIGRRAGKIP